MKKSGKEKYKGCTISWSVYGENYAYNSKACVTIHNNSYTEDTMLDGLEEKETLKEAENHIIKVAKKWIDER